MRPLLPLFAGVFAAALAAGAGFGVRRAQLMAAPLADSVALAHAVGTDTAGTGTAGADSTSRGAGAGIAALTDSLAADTTTHGDSIGGAYVLGASDDPAGAARAALAAEGMLATGTSDGTGRTEGALAAAGTAPSGSVAPAVRPSTGDAAPTVSVRRLAKIFGTMAPRDAAKVLAQLGDDDVQTLMAHLSDRQAAAVMGSIPPERAAKITGSTLRIARETTP